MSDHDQEEDKFEPVLIDPALRGDRAWLDSALRDPEPRRLSSQLIARTENRSL